jgi:hypothetical protein
LLRQSYSIDRYHVALHVMLQEYHGAIDTNNHLEAMNRRLKRDLLAALTMDMRLESLLEAWCGHILPQYHQEYVQENMKSARCVRTVAMP